MGAHRRSIAIQSVHSVINLASKRRDISLAVQSLRNSGQDINYLRQTPRCLYLSCLSFRLPPAVAICLHLALSSDCLPPCLPVLALRVRRAIPRRLILWRPTRMTPSILQTKGAIMITSLTMLNMSLATSARLTARIATM